MKKAHLQERIAQCYAEFGLFEEATEAIERAKEILNESSHVQRYRECVSTALEIEARRILVKETDKKENYSLGDFEIDIETRIESNLEIVTELAPPHTERYRQIVKYLATGESDISKEICKKYFEITDEISEEQKFFHWELEFPEIFLNEDATPKENPGFDLQVRRIEG